MDSELVRVFCELVKIPSPSGKELEVARYVWKYLKRVGVASVVDGAGKAVGSNSGNVIAKIGRGNPKILFVAHMDTVEDGIARVKPVMRGGIIWSDGTTILGADDKAGIAALLVAAKELKRTENAPGAVLVFSVREEGGVMGVNHLEIDKSVDFVFDVDGSNPPGVFINKALGNQTFEIRIRGKEAHAALNPEIGRNAIKAAATLISRLELGRNRKGGAMNIGTIAGGKAPNVIPGYAVLTGEIRAYALRDMVKSFKALKRATKDACTMTGCKFEITQKGLEPPLNTMKNSDIVALARKASVRAGVNFSLKTMPATIQGCVLASKNRQVLGLSKGGIYPHSFSESISVKEMEQTKRLIIAAVKLADR